MQKRFNFTMPMKLWERLKTFAKRNKTTAKVVIQKAISLWLTVKEIEENGGIIFVREQDGSERELIVID